MDELTKTDARHVFLPGHPRRACVGVALARRHRTSRLESLYEAEQLSVAFVARSRVPSECDKDRVARLLR